MNVNNKKNLLARLGIVTRELRWGLLIALVAVAVTFYLLTKTQYIHQINEFLANGWGIYDVSFVLIIIVVILFSLPKIWSFLCQAFKATNVTPADNVTLAVVLWGILLWFGPLGYSALATIDWANLFKLQIYVQIVWILSLIWLIIVRVIWGLIRFFNQKKVILKPRLHSDQAIGLHKSDEDLLGRSNNIVKQIVSIIKDYSSEGAFVIAVTGEWGTGKTTTINFARQHLVKDKEVILVEFDPWYFSVGGGQNLDTLLKRFFETLEKAVNPHVRTFNPDFSKYIKDYYKAIAPLVEKVPVRFDFLLEQSPKDLQKIRQELNDTFKQLDERVVVIIDDLDRMDGTEIAYVFKLIRLCANFDNLTYIVAFDESFVRKQLKTVLRGKVEEYTDKIIQLKLPLPSFEPTTLDKIFQDHLGQIEKQLDIALFKEQQFTDRLDRGLPHIRLLLNNIRLINQFANRYLLVLPRLKGEINYFDLMILEIIRLRHPDIYEEIYRHPEYFTNGAYYLHPSGESFQKRTAQFFETLGKELNQDSRDAVFELMGSLFPPVYNYHKQRQIYYEVSQSAANPFYLSRYFTMAVQPDVFSDIEWDAFKASINGAANPQLRRLIKGMIEEASRRQAIAFWRARMSFIAKDIDKEKIPTIILAIVEALESVSDKRDGVVDYEVVSYFVINLLDQLELDRFEKVVIKIAETCPNIAFLHSIIALLDLRKAEQAAPFPQLNLEKPRQIAADCIKKNYLTNNRNILQESKTELYALEYYLTAEDYRPYVQRLLKEDPQNIIRFLERMTFGDNKNGRYIELEYERLKKYIEPAKLRELIDEAQLSLDGLEANDWVFSALCLGIEAESKGNPMAKISKVRANEFRPATEQKALAEKK